MISAAVGGPLIIVPIGIVTGSGPPGPPPPQVALGPLRVYHDDAEILEARRPNVRRFFVRR